MMEATYNKKLGIESYVCIRHEVVVEVSNSFVAAIGFTREELVGKNILHVLNEMLKLNKRVEGVDKLASIESCFAFNKLMDFKEFSIEVKRAEEENLIYLYFEQLPLIDVNNSLSYTHQIICNSTNGMAMYYAEDFTLLKANDEYKKIMYDRYNQLDIVGRKVYEFSPGWINSEDKLVWENLIETQKPFYKYEKPSLNPQTGVLEYYDSSVSPILNKGRVKFFVTTLSNVTEKVKYRQENENKALMIKKQKELLEAVIENQSHSIYIIDSKGDIIISNKEGKQRFAPRQINSIKDLYSAAEFYDLNGKKLTLKDMPASHLIKGEVINNTTIRAQTKDKSMYINLNGTPIYDEKKSFEYAFMSGADITELVESKQQIANQMEQLKAIVENMSDAIFISDQHGKYILQNRAALELFDKELKNTGDAHNVARFYEFDGEEISRENMPEVRMEKGIGTKDRVIQIKLPHKELYVSVSTTPIFDSQGNYTMGVLSSRDITDQVKRNETIKEQHKALLMAEKKEKENLEKVIAMKDEFLSLISHEFKTPLTVINSALQTLELVYSDQLTDKVRAYMDKIKQNTYRQVRLVNNLLDITRANAGRIKLNIKNLDIVFLTRSIMESVNLYAHQRGVNISFISKCKQKYIALDEEKYERIILNLLSNAIKFTPEGKNITVSLMKKGKSIAIEVKDEGVGIPEEKLELIFERFGQVDNTYTRQVEGSGIGLTLVRQMVNAMGGNVSVESSLGVGSSFLVELPDRRIQEPVEGAPAREQIDTRLIQSIAIEFSDIYF